MKLKMLLLMLAGLMIMSCGEDEVTSVLGGAETKASIIGSWEMTKTTTTVNGTKIATEGEELIAGAKAYTVFDTDTATFVADMPNILDPTAATMMILVEKFAYKITGDSIYVTENGKEESAHINIDGANCVITDISGDTTEVTEFIKTDAIDVSGVKTMEQFTTEMFENLQLDLE